MQKASAIMIAVPSTPEIAIAPTIAWGTAVAALEVSSLMCTAESYALSTKVVSQRSLLGKGLQAIPNSPMYWEIVSDACGVFSQVIYLRACPQ
jgi:hypothetical protein